MTTVAIPVSMLFEILVIFISSAVVLGSVRSQMAMCLNGTNTICEKEGLQKMPVNKVSWEDLGTFIISFHNARLAYFVCTRLHGWLRLFYFLISHLLHWPWCVSRADASIAAVIIYLLHKHMRICCKCRGDRDTKNPEAQWNSGPTVGMSFKQKFWKIIFLIDQNTYTCTFPNFCH